MTIQPPETQQQPRLTRSRPRRAADYRLRGLDLEAQALAEPPVHAVRKPPRNLRRWRRLLIQWVVVLTLTATVTMLVRASVVRPYSVSSTSMEPTLQSGTEILVAKSTFLRGTIKTGSIVVFRQPAGSTCSSGGGGSHYLVNRVIAVAGETIWSAQGSVYVNGARLNEPGWYNPPFGELGRIAIARTTVPPGSYFVMGDNRTDPCDSRSFGPVPKSELVGRAIATIARNGHPFVHSI